MLNRILLLPLAGLALAASMHPATARCTSFIDTPEEFGGMKLIFKKPYPARGKGVVIKFSGQGQILTIYRFDNSHDTFSDDVLRGEVETETRKLRAFTEQRGDAVVSSESLEAWTVGRRTFHAETVQATYKSYNVTAFEYVGLSHDTECLFKVRFTNAADASDDASLQRFKRYVAQASTTLLKPEEPPEEDAEEKPADGEERAEAASD